VDKLINSEIIRSRDYKVVTLGVAEFIVTLYMPDLSGFKRLFRAYGIFVFFALFSARRELSGPL